MRQSVRITRGHNGATGGSRQSPGGGAGEGSTRRALARAVALLAVVVGAVALLPPSAMGWEPENQDYPPPDCEIWPETCPPGWSGDWGGSGCYRCVQVVEVTPEGSFSYHQCWSNHHVYPGSGRRNCLQRGFTCQAWGGVCFNLLA